jgi:N-methylhydantoinase A
VRYEGQAFEVPLDDHRRSAAAMASPASPARFDAEHLRLFTFNMDTRTNS